MNVKNNMKKIFALGASGALVATTLVGAFANLADYPAPFIVDGALDAAIVVGQNAAIADMLGAVDIAASLQAKAVTEVEVAGSTAVAVEGGELIEDLDFNTAFPLTDSTYDEGDLVGFVDDEVEVNDNTYDYHDDLILESNYSTIKTSLETNDKEYGFNPYMNVDEGFITYKLTFDDLLLNSDLMSGTTQVDTAEIKFLGKTMEIKDFDASSIDVEASTEEYLEEGMSVTVEGHEITLIRVGDGSVRIQVDGQTKVIEKGEDAKFDEAGDFNVEVESLFYIEGAADNGANLVLGNDLTYTIDETAAADDFFGGTDELNEADWVWDITANTTHLTSIAIVSNQDYEDVTVKYEDTERPALELGEAISLPNDYASVEFATLKESDYYDLTISLDENDNLYDADSLDELNDASVIKFEIDGGNYFEVDGTESNAIYYALTASGYELWYDNKGDETNATTQAQTFTLVIDDDTVSFDLSLLDTVANAAGSVAFSMEFNEGSSTAIETIYVLPKFDTTTPDEGFGTDVDESDSDDLRISVADANIGNATSIGAKDFDLLTTYGLKIDAPETQLGDNDLVISVPKNYQQSTVVIKSEGTTSSTTSGATYTTVNDAALGLAILDADAPALGSKPMIVVGGPVINTVAAELMGNLQPEQIAETFEAGKAMIKFYGDKNAVLVAGYEAAETQAACAVLAKYENYALAGDEMEVIGTNIDTVVVNTVN